MTSIYDAANEKSKASFPGYEQYVAKQQEEKQKRAERIATRDNLREAKRKNSLPPFLMVRAGVYNVWLIPLLGLASCIAAAGSEQYLSPSMHTLACVASGLVLAPGLLCALVATPNAIQHAQTYSNDIRRALNDYAESAQLAPQAFASTDFPRISGRLLQLIARHKAKNDARLFNNMLKNPNSIKNATVATNIVLGHLKSHPTDAAQVASVFDITTMPKNLQNHILRIIRAHSK